MKIVVKFEGKKPVKTGFLRVGQPKPTSLPEELLAVLQETRVSQALDLMNDLAK